MEKRKIVYIVKFNISLSDEMECIGQQIAWLSANTPYEIHAIIPSKAYLPTSDDLPHLANIVYPEHKTPTTEDDEEYSLLDNIKRIGAFLSKNTGLSAFKEKIRYKRFIKKFLKEQPDTDLFIIPIYSSINFLSCIRNGKKIIGELDKPPTVLTYQNKKNWIIKWQLSLLRKRLKKINAVVVKNQKTSTSIAAYTKVPTCFIPNSLKIWPEQPSDTINNRIVSVIDSGDEENFIMLINAWKIILAKHPEWRLNLYGTVNEEKVKEKIKEKRLSWYVRYYPLKEEMTNVYLKSALIILFSARENKHRIKEAFSYGLPVISFKCRESSEMIHDENNGFLILNNNWKDLEIKTRILINNEELRKKMSRNARETVSNCQLENVMTAWCSLIENVSATF